MNSVYSQTFQKPDALFNPSPYGFSHVAVVGVTNTTIDHEVSCKGYHPGCKS